MSFFFISPKYLLLIVSGGFEGKCVHYGILTQKSFYSELKHQFSLSEHLKTFYAVFIFSGVGSNVLYLSSHEILPQWKKLSFLYILMELPTTPSNSHDLNNFRKISLSWQPQQKKGVRVQLYSGSVCILAPSPLSSWVTYVSYDLLRVTWWESISS